MTGKEIFNFESREVSYEEARTIEEMGRMYENLYDLIKENLNSSRHQSLCLTALEESSMWLMKYIARNPLNVLQ